MVTIPLLLDHVADFVWRHGRESNPSWSDRQSVALPEDYCGINLVLSIRIELMSTGYQPIALAIELQEELLVEREGIEPLVATLLNVTTGLQPATGNTLH